jgi:aspartyl-tRNA(Asn)/glutamyl-tRNA(Gln) amidotransferase subunit A
MAHSVEDLALMLTVMAGHDKRDATSSQRSTEDFSQRLNQSMKDKVIGIPKEYFSASLDPAIQQIITEAIKTIEKLGATIKDVSLPSTSLVVPTYYVLASAECSSNMSRYDGVRFGHRCNNAKSIDDLYERSRAEGFGKEVKRRILMGTYALSSGYYDAYYKKAQKIRRLVKNDYIAAFEQVDFLIGPTSPTIAFLAEAFAHDPVQMYLSDAYTVSANLAGLPSLSLPAGFSQGMPVGMQMTGNYFMESDLLSLGHAYQMNTDWHNRYTTKNLGL